jgi:hypothetical protein
LKLTKTQKNFRKQIAKFNYRTSIYDNLRAGNPFQTSEHNYNESNGIATASLVFGIVGLILGLAPFVGWLTFPLWILAIIFGMIGRRKYNGRSAATAGLVIGLITIIYKVGFLILLSSAAQAIQNNIPKH